MKKNIVEKILSDHIIEGKPKKGTEVGIRIDQTLTQDATGTMAYLQFEAMGVPKVKTELSVSYVDHNTVQIGFENADDHKYLQSVAAKYGIVYSRAGNGICHQVQLERFGKPGKTLLGSDSHTPTGGGIGMMAIGAGGLDVAVAMAGGPFYLPYPKVIKINLTGKLRPWVAAKDVILKVLEIFTTKGNVGCVFEYGGSGINTLSVPERATITNMGAECGVTTSIFPSDEVTKEFLRAQDREHDWVELIADDDAEYDQIVEIDLSELVPMAATPHSPGNISTVRDIGEIDVDQVCVGSCTNSSYKDMMTVAEILKGKKLHSNTSFVVAPGSKQVIENIIRDGGFESIVSAGARIAESACGFCIGNGCAPSTNAVSIRTNNRNFKGRSGTPSANVYLASPETAAACAITGKITDPRDLEFETPEIPDVEEFKIDDSMILAPGKPDKNVQIYRGPNIGDPPKGTPITGDISGEVMIKVGDKITTDHIMPAGARLKYRSNIPKYSEFVFEPVDPTFPERCLKNKENNKANIIVAGLSYGQGSSREHAAICPSYLNVKAVIAKSIERIHHSNLINFGILPLEFINEKDYENLESGDNIKLTDLMHSLDLKKPILIHNESKDIKFEVKYTLSDREIKIIKSGGLLQYIKENK